MRSQHVSRRRRLAILLARAATFLCSGGGLLIFIILLSWYNDREAADDKPDDNSCAYKYLPIVAVAFSAGWNLFSLVTYGMRSAKWLSRRFKLYTDIGCAVQLAVLGYLGFIYDVLTDWREAGYVPMSEKRVEVIGITLLSISGAAHLVFFCYGCAEEAEEESAEFPSNGGPWDGTQLQAVKSIRSDSSAFDADSLRTTRQFSPTVARRETVDSSGIPASSIAPYNPYLPSPSASPPLPATTLSGPDVPAPLTVPHVALTNPPPPNPFDHVPVPVYTPGCYGTGFNTTSLSHHDDHFTDDDIYESYNMLTPRAAPSPPMDRKPSRGLRVDTTETNNSVSRPTTSSAVSSLHTNSLTSSSARNWPVSPISTSESRTPPRRSSQRGAGPRHGRSMSSVSRLASLALRGTTSQDPAAQQEMQKLQKHRRAASSPTPPTSPPAGAMAPDYLPGGYVTNLEMLRSGEELMGLQLYARDEDKPTYR